MAVFAGGPALRAGARAAADLVSGDWGRGGEARRGMAGPASRPQPKPRLLRSLILKPREGLAAHPQL